MIHQMTRDEIIERIIEMKTLYKYITMENIINCFSNLEEFKRNNPNVEIDYFCYETSENEEKIGVKYVDENKKEHYMYFLTDSTEKTQIKRIIIGSTMDVFLNLLVNEFKNNVLICTTIALILIRDIRKEHKKGKLPIKYNHKFNLLGNNNPVNITELDVTYLKATIKSIKAFNKLFEKSKLTKK